MKSKTILVLGGNGFIARSLVERIKKNNVTNLNLFLIDRDIKKFKEDKINNNSIYHIKVNLQFETEINKLIRLLKNKKIKKIDEVWNLCANSDIKISNLDNDLNNTYLSCFYSAKLFDFYKIDQIQYSDIRSVDNDEEFVKTLYEIYLKNGLSYDITESNVIIEMSRIFINTLGSTQTIISDLRETLTSDIDFETLIAQIYVFYNDIHIGYLTSLFPIKKDLPGEVKGTIRGVQGGSRNDLGRPFGGLRKAGLFNNEGYLS